MKDEKGWKIVAGFVALKPKTYSYLTDDGNENSKAKGTKICVIKSSIWRLYTMFISNSTWK